MSGSNKVPVFEVTLFCEITYRVTAISKQQAEDNAIKDIEDSLAFPKPTADPRAQYEGVVFSDAITNEIQGEK